MTQSGNTYAESMHLCFCEVDENDVVLQSCVFEEKIGEGFSWIKGYIDVNLKQNMPEKISKIPGVKTPTLHRSDFSRYIKLNLNFDQFGQGFVKGLKRNRLFQILTSINLNIGVKTQMFVDNEDDICSSFNSAFDIYSLLQIIDSFDVKKKVITCEAKFLYDDDRNAHSCVIKCNIL